ncbi:energy transducer TonB [Dysgonomonas macrotermitis]|uniref:TonB protein C-terminal n=1 Tax=Dysgonomonas macrotermitis TaxID=1346286 RepID=A0A1M4Y990_9BACT|nr:energy transducer TonB [Dysgonomonas macrotermitis]SHF02052.1 TonB protein C-terminal [Dysgonomonas macrotermitis]
MKLSILFIFFVYTLGLSAQVSYSYPEFTGGEGALNEYLLKNINYPQSAINSRLQGRVTANCIIGSDGSVEQVSIVEPLSVECDSVVRNALMRMPQWTHNRANTVPHWSLAVITIYFELKSDSIPKLDRTRTAVDYTFPLLKSTKEVYEDLLMKQLKAKNKSQKLSGESVIIEFGVLDNGLLSEVEVLDSTTKDRQASNLVIQTLNNVRQWKPLTGNRRLLDTRWRLSVDFYSAHEIFIQLDLAEIAQNSPLLYGDSVYQPVNFPYRSLIRFYKPVSIMQVIAQ